LAFDACLAATGAAAPAWPAASGLAVDADGFIRVGPTLQSLSHPQVFAAGDVAALADARPKSGVYAVRAGPVLAHNLRAFCESRPLLAWSPQARALYLISTGERHALATWGRWSWSGRWVWRWKDRIDRAFVARYTRAP
jgi:selenide,water dikinase